MAAVQQAPVSSPATSDPPWRKRPAQISVPTIQHPPKRLKTSTFSSPGPASGGNPPSGGSGGPSSGQAEQNGRVKAERWFDEVNEHPKDVPFVDNDPPYYMQKASTSDENIANIHRPTNPANGHLRIGPTAPTRSLLAQMDAHNDNTDDFRSVIDDLTIQNKKLKKKLKKYEKLHCSHLQEEKLFEVRVHGLAANRKRQLEETLRSFASSIDDDSLPRPVVVQESDTKAAAPGNSTYKPSSSSTSLSKPQDSGYASMSGQTGVLHPQQAEQIPLDPHHMKRQNVKSYLHDIPENLAPRPYSFMSDRLKSKLVVKRLEQLFTGKGAARSRQNHSHQQQEVSQSAAQADRRKIEAGGTRVWKEGTREAHILPDDTDLQVDTMEDVNATAQLSGSNAGSRSRSTQGSQVSGSPRSPEQRPTRPLDLDIHRAQVPSDNIEYIRHLGLVSPTTEGPDREPALEDGWVYLNLLTSMAQLHTLNVTPEFIRKAISGVSAMFELSPDGTKVRWLGGREGTKMSSDSGESDEQTNWASSDPSISSVKRGSFAEVSSKEDVQGQPGVNPSAPQGGTRRRLVNLQEPDNMASKFQYKPLFFHAADSEDSDNSALRSDSLSSSEAQDFTTGDHSGSLTQRDREARLRGRRRDDGPIIFYNRARFCTDLSGDVQNPQTDRAMYYRLTEHPLGCPSNLSDCASQGDDEAKSSSRSSDSLKPDSARSGRSALDLEDLKSSISDCLSIRGPATAMEASGLGGVRPDDNFVVKVQVRHAGKKKHHLRKLTSFSKPKGPIRKIWHNLPQKSMDAFKESSNSPRSQPAIESEILSTTKTNMPPSALPPPSYVCVPFSSSDSDQDDDDENADAEMSSGSNDDPNHPYLHPNPTKHSSVPQNYFGYARGDVRYSSSSEKVTTSSDDSSSIDLLAHAREFAPDYVAAREQEFERNTASQRQSMARDIVPVPLPAGSVAATAGGGSVRGSPVQGRRVLSRVGEDDDESDVDSMSVDRNSESSD